jgi:hypothetical protein
MNAGQVALFHEAIEDAMASDVAALGGPGKVSAWLFPHLAPEQGKAMVRACLNQERAEKLSPYQLLQLKKKAREIGACATVTYEAQELGYLPQWQDPQDESDELRREVRDLLRAVNQRMDRIERAESRVVAIRK